MTRFFTLLAVFLSVFVSGQISYSQTPHFQSFQPVMGNQPNNANAPQYQNPIPQTQMGRTANDIMRQQNANRTQTPTPQNLGQSRTRQQQEYQEIVRDAQEAGGISKQAIKFSFPSHSLKPGASYYRNAYNEIVRMLTTGKYDIKRAVFLVENAYMDNQMSYELYAKKIKQIADFCLLKMKEEQKDITSNEEKNETLFRLLSDTLTIQDPTTGNEITHYPVRYDFDDYMGYEDWKNMFVTKLLGTNYGQCHSMPSLYLIVASEMGANAYLSTSPSHSFIKYKRGNQWRNVELTNGHITSDDWLMASGYIKSEGIKSRLYLDTISMQQTIALCLEDLAKGYALKYGGYDDFALQCINSSLKYYPNSWAAMGEKADYYTMLFQYVAGQTGYDNLEQVLTIPQARNIFTQMKAMYDALDNAGYAQMPPEAYEEWLRSIDREKRNREYEDYKRYKQSMKQNSLQLEQRSK